MTPGPDQIFSFFAHWALPRYGLESYSNGADRIFQRFREMLTEPNHSRGYTTGFQWVGNEPTRLRVFASRLSSQMSSRAAATVQA